MNEPKDYEYLLLCDGSTISDENYPELVAVLGGTQLPNLIDRVVQGAATAGTYKEARLPNITASISNRNAWNYKSASGAFIVTGDPATINGANQTSDYAYAFLNFNASRCSSVYGASTTVQPPAYTAKIYICYAG